MDFKTFFETEIKKEKPWYAKTQDILRMWRSLPAGQPLRIHPIPAVHKGTRYDDDGIRITGTATFINSVLSHLKAFLEYEMLPGMELDVEYRHIKPKGGEIYREPVFVCYIYVTQTKPKKIKVKAPPRPKKFVIH